MNDEEIKKVMMDYIENLEKKAQLEKIMGERNKTDVVKNAIDKLEELTNEDQ